MKNFTLISALLLLSTAVFSQVGHSANDFILPYDGVFRPGANPGSTPPWTDEQLADIAAGNPELGIDGAGIKAFRPLLSEDFVETYGYDLRISTYQHYDALGLKDNTMMVGFPSDDHRDPAFYCAGSQSELFAGMYLDIWDDGANGTPYNDDNYYAAYLYKLVTRYKDYVKFWEIWNEPGFDYTGALGWFPRGAPGNWWDNNPDPCDYKLRAPIFHYVRLLRISYEVIKTVDPEGFVTLSGVGYPSFLDAILRNTDNPVDGSESADYPLKGGAYFDVMGFHSYPHFDGSVKVWSDEANGFIYSRHSDAAAEGLTKSKNIFQEVLDEYGYDGNAYPEKHWIITECNIPRREFSDFIGSELAQRNFLMKAYVECLISDILQLHVFSLGEEGIEEEALSEFELMGLYQHLEDSDVYYPIPNEEAIGYKTTSDLLFNKTYDPVQTAALQLPENVKGIAVADNDGRYTYVLWAKTEVDRSEEGATTFSFPSGLTTEQLIFRQWDFSQSREQEFIGNSSINLTTTPIFLTETAFTIQNPGPCVPTSIVFDAANIEGAAEWSWTFEGAEITSSTQEAPTVNFTEAGEHSIRLTIKNTQGEVLINQTQVIHLEEPVQPSYTAYQSGPIVRLNNNSSFNADSYLWDFGDGTTSNTPNPQHVYFESGNYTIRLTATNECGEFFVEQEFEITVPTTSQLSQTANDIIVPYNEGFRPGVNLGFYPPWTDQDLANIAGGNIALGIPGAGAKSVRPSLDEEFLEFWGYDIRLDAFQHYANLDLKDNTVIVGFPSDDHKDPNFYCPTHQSELFANMYTDIWDNGENGTPVNDENFYAKYLWETAIRYGDQIKFWEIWNEPSFDYSGVNGWLAPGARGNWWDKDPDPCDYKLRAPIQHFVRLLRISYEVIKHYDPEAFVTLSGVAFPSFLDAVLRNTDNPVDGSAANGYPLGGGAYFDVTGFHSYPHFDGSTSRYDVDLGDWVYNRNSDAAADGIGRIQDTLRNILHQYGYDDSDYPQKHWIITEVNVPRKKFGEFIGSEEASRNYILKAFVAAMQNEVLQLHVFKLGEEQNIDNAFFEFDVMGLYQRLEGIQPGEEVINGQGIAYKTASDLLFGSTYSESQTAQMELPAGVRGAAFENAEGEFTYTLWAETLEDDSEEANASYSFPAGLLSGSMFKKEWDFSQTQQMESIPSENIELNGTPIFVSESATALQPPVAALTSSVQSACPPMQVDFQDLSTNAEEWLWTFEGGIPTTSTAQHPTVVFDTPGNYNVSLKVTNAAGSHTIELDDYIEVKGLPEAGFSHTTEGSFGFFTITIENDSTDYLWDFGDGFVFPAYNPSHFYFLNGEYEVLLIATNACGSDTTSQIVNIAAPPIADFGITVLSDCPPFEVKFQDQSTASPSNWIWDAEGGSPTNPVGANPVVSYSEPGTYTTTMIVDNGVATDTISKTFSLTAGAVTNINQTLCRGESITVNEVIYDESNPSGTETIEGGTIDGCDSIIHVSLNYFDENSFNLELQLCQGQSITVNGNVYDESQLIGTEIFENGATNGCDSIVHISLSFVEELHTDLEFQICEGEGIIVGDSVYTQTGSYQEIFVSSFGCDSIVSLDLEVYENSLSEFNFEICQGETFEGVMINSDTLIENILINQFGCDSIIQNQVTVLPSYYSETADTIFADESIFFYGIELTEPGLYPVFFTSMNGCDSIEALNLTVLDIVNVIEQESNTLDIQAFPNPFDDQLTVSFNLNTKEEITIRILDLQGKLVSTLYQNKTFIEGKHELFWMTDHLAPGVYLVELIAERASATTKMVKVE